MKENYEKRTQEERKNIGKEEIKGVINRDYKTKFDNLISNQFLVHKIFLNKFTRFIIE